MTKIEQITAIDKVLKDETNKIFLIFGHENPDGDALGAMLAMKFLIEKYYSTIVDKKEARICITEKNQKNLSKSFLFLPGLKNFLETETFYEKLDGDVAIFMESSNVKRTGFEKENLNVKTIVNIDHHKINDFFGDINWVDEKKAAVCEMVYMIYKQLGKNIDLETAICLYVGILTDTGRFQYSNTTVNIYEIIKDLVEKGIDVNFIYKSIYGNKTKNHMLFIKELLNNLEFFKINSILFSYSFIDSEFIEKNMIKSEDTEGAADYIRDIENVEISIFAKPKNNGIFKFSLRSKGNFAVDKISAFFGGGGHSSAAGFDLKAKNILEAKKIVLAKINELFG